MQYIIQDRDCWFSQQSLIIQRGITVRLVSILRISATILLGSILLVVLLLFTDRNGLITRENMGEQVNVMILFFETIAPALLGCFTLLFVRRRTESSHWQTWGAITVVGTIVTVGGLLMMSNIYIWMLRFPYTFIGRLTDGRITALSYFWILAFIREVPDVLLYLGIVILLFLIVAWGFSKILPQQKPVILTAPQRRREELYMTGITLIIIVVWYFLPFVIPLSVGQDEVFLSFSLATFWFTILPFPLLVLLSLLPRNTNVATK